MASCMNPQLIRKRSSGSIVKCLEFDETKSANEIFKAIDGIGTDENTIIKLIAECNCEQRQQIMEKFRRIYQKDLLKELKSELKIRFAKDFKQLLLALFQSPIEYDAVCLKAATKGLGTDEKALIEILATRTPEHLAKVREEYERRYTTTLKHDVADDTSGDFRKVAYTLSRGLRKTGDKVDVDKARVIAGEINSTYTKLKGTDEPRYDFVGLCCKESFAMCNAVFSAYEKLTGRNICLFIDDEFSGDTSDGLKAIVKCAKSIPEYFAERLFKSMDGLGTDDDTLIRIVVSRAEVDMNIIREKFLKLYNDHLENAIKGDTSGWYRRLLLAIVSGNYGENQQ